MGVLLFWLQVIVGVLLATSGHAFSVVIGVVILLRAGGSWALRERRDRDPSHPPTD